LCGLPSSSHDSPKKAQFLPPRCSKYFCLSQAGGLFRVPSPGPLTQTNEECDRRAIGRIERIVLWEKLCFGGIRCDEADGRAAHPKAVNFDFGPALRKRCGVFGPVTFVHANAGEAEHDRL
jgi:hypothetical protein